MKARSRPQSRTGVPGFPGNPRPRRTGNSFGRSPQASANLSDGDRRRVDLYARPHGRGNRHALDVVALGANRLRLDDSVCESLDVFFQSLGVEGSLADAGMDDTSL